MGELSSLELAPEFPLGALPPWAKAAPTEVQLS